MRFWVVVREYKRKLQVCEGCKAGEKAVVLWRVQVMCCEAQGGQAGQTAKDGQVLQGKVCILGIITVIRIEFKLQGFQPGEPGKYIPDGGTILPVNVEG
jgi:hypothetical protein